MEELRHDELQQRLTRAERECDRLAGENLQLTAERARLRRRVSELDEALARRLQQYLDLKVVVDLRDELGEPPHPSQTIGAAFVNCGMGTIGPDEAAERLSIPADEFWTFLHQTRYPVVCGCHGYRIVEPSLDGVRVNYQEWTVALFKAQLDGK
jgi:hypothetical protein